MNGPVAALLALPDGGLVAGGGFTTAGFGSASGIARWDGTNWLPLGSGVGAGASGALWVSALARMPNGDVVAGGAFTTAGGASANRIARWNGTSWSALGSGMDYAVNALAARPNGDLVAGGVFTFAGGVFAPKLALWNGASWAALPQAGFGSVKCLAALPNGDIVAGGQSSTFQNIARWNGATWLPMGGATQPGPFFQGEVAALAALPNGHLIVGGTFTSAGGIAVGNIARWKGGSIWESLGSLPIAVAAVGLLPNGDVVAGGANGSLARWNGTSWSSLTTNLNGAVSALAQMANGELVAGGAFYLAPSFPYVAHLKTNCPATATAYGSGCAGAAGQVTLAALALPWIGATATAVASGMPTNSLAVGVFGFAAAAIPLSMVHPQGLPGCSLLVSPDVLFAYVPSGGSVTTQVAIPNSVSLTGQVFRHQVATIELDAQGILQGLASSNALMLTMGML